MKRYRETMILAFFVLGMALIVAKVVGNWLSHIL